METKEYVKTFVRRWVNKARCSSSMAASLNGHPSERKIHTFSLKRSPRLPRVSPEPRTAKGQGSRGQPRGKAPGPIAFVDPKC